MIGGVKGCCFLCLRKKTRKITDIHLNTFTITFSMYYNDYFSIAMRKAVILVSVYKRIMDSLNYSCNFANDVD